MAETNSKSVSLPIPPPELHPMETFDPGEPAILHDRRADKIVPWDGDEAADFRRTALRHADGTVEWNGMLLDGWGNVLGG